MSEVVSGLRGPSSRRHSLRSSRPKISEGDWRARSQVSPRALWRSWRPGSCRLCAIRATGFVQRRRWSLAAARALRSCSCACVTAGVPRGATRWALVVPPSAPWATCASTPAGCSAIADSVSTDRPFMPPRADIAASVCAAHGHVLPPSLARDGRRLLVVWASDLPGLHDHDSRWHALPGVLQAEHPCDDDAQHGHSSARHVSR